MLRGSGVMAVACAAALALIAPSGALAARPGATTGAAANVAQTTATFTGTVDPNRRATTYFFEYGPTPAYGATTAPAPAGGGAGPVRVAADVAGLAPYTRYHFRIVASNRDGVRRGGGRRFRTRAQPLGLTLAASANPVAAGRSFTLTGVLSGTGNTGRVVRLQANPFPFLAGFNAVGSPVVTDGTGAFSFPVLALTTTTQFRAYVEDASNVVSAPVAVGAAVRVTTRVTRLRRVRRGVRVRFSGRVYPARDGVRVDVQKLDPDGQWRTVKRTVARHAARGYSRYAKRFRIRRRGLYRVVAYSEGEYVTNHGRFVRVRPRGRR